MQATSSHRRPLPAFLCAAAAIYVANIFLARTHAQWSTEPFPEWAVAFDVFLLIPVLYLLILRPTFRKAGLAAFALVSLGILVGSFAIPPDEKAWWTTFEQVRWIYLGALAAAQITVIGAVLRDIRRNRHAPNLEFAIEGAIARRVREPAIRRLLQADARMWAYALVRNHARFTWPAEAFFGAKHDSNASNQQAFLLLMVAEVPIAHFFIHLLSPTAAIVVSALSLYGLVFLLAEYRATLYRGSTLQCDHLHVRSGVLGDLIVPYACVRSIERVSHRPRRARRALRYTGTGTANVKLVLDAGTRLDTLAGSREVDVVYLGLDEPERFLAELRSRLGT
ncbi:hypothetical protein [Sphingobium sp.]|uniref:hypothetical protein n=1 Tax=Sphingobium sp. TaxID=1912891 RepID=UPI002D1566E4|nr:hypothetical protein [Sphingobium sp.]HUD94050.1 hypothetical protein [Sphingobium sp.]